MTTAAAQLERHLEEIVRRLVELYQPVRIYLFGSVARGEAGPDSDIDLLVVLPDDAPLASLVPTTAYSALRGLGLPVNVVPWSISGFEGRLHRQASLPATVAREGRLLYAR